MAVESRLNPTPLLLVLGLIAFGIAGLSVFDMFLPRPYAGVFLKTDAAQDLVVAHVVESSGADRAGIRRGDVIAGIAREAVRDAGHATQVINRHRIGDEVLYLVRKPGGLEETRVRLGRRKFGDGTYLYSSLLGFSFFFVGLFVLVRQPGLRASQVFFGLCTLFLLVLVCRMRPASFSGIDGPILGVGTVAFLFLPPAFLHFFLIFPRPAWLDAAAKPLPWRWLARGWRRAWPAIYLVPPLLFLLTFWLGGAAGAAVELVNGVPTSHWWLLAGYMVLGLGALWVNARHLEDPRERRGAALVLVGSVFGLLPFLVFSVAFATFQYSQGFFFFAILPLVLVPVTFTYAIVRFQLLDIRVILRRSLLYTVTTAFVTGLYAGAIATFNAVFRGSSLATSGYFPIILALAIVLLFEPVRRRIQEAIDRFFFAGRSRLQRAMVELGEAVAGQADLEAVVRELVDELPRLLDVGFAVLYLVRGGRLQREAGPPTLPETLDLPESVRRHLGRHRRLLRAEQLAPLALTDPAVGDFLSRLDAAGIEVLGDLRSRRRHLGLVLLAARPGQAPLEPEELDLLRSLLDQASLALETSLLIEERTQKAELEREMEIAATIQARLLPASLGFAAGWQVAAVCRPARIVGGDFFAQLTSPAGDPSAVIFGDVSGKSVSGALMMMAAHEALHALAITHPLPGELFTLANRRVYALGRRNFVALGYFWAEAESLRYAIAGQPPPIVRRRDGRIEELPLPVHRIPVGALPEGRYETLTAVIEPGDLVVGYSDGVTDARSPSGELYEVDRLRAVIAASPPDPDAVVANILEAVDVFTRGTTQYDDLTLVAVGRPLPGSTPGDRP